MQTRDREALHLTEVWGPLGGEVLLCWPGRTQWGRGNLVLESWNFLTAAQWHLLPTVSSAFMIWVERARVRFLNWYNRH